MILMAAVLYCLLLVSQVHAAEPEHRNLVGGMYPVDVHDPEVVDAEQFAMKRAYSGGHKQIDGHILVEANYQIVNGKRYILIVEVKEHEQVCVSKQFEVWNRAGPPGQFLVGNTQLSRPCIWF